MTIVRVAERERDPFARISRASLQDSRLSYKATGLLAALLSRPDDWMVRTKALSVGKRGGYRSVRSALEELEEAGYAELVCQRSADGKVESWEWLIFERAQKPDSQNVDVDNQIDVLPHLDNATSGKTATYIQEKELTYKRKNLQNVQPDASGLHQPSVEGRLEPDSEPGTEGRESLSWPPSLQEIPAQLDEIRAPAGFYDPAFWQRIEVWLGSHPTVGYLDELRRYVTWWYSMPPTKRRKQVQRSFTTWLRTEEAKANNRAERIKANGQKSSQR